MKPGAEGLSSGQKLCRYVYDAWWDGGRLYVKVTGIEYERATWDSFALAARRKMRRILELEGLDPAFTKGIGAIEEWDVAHNWADGLPEAYVFRTRDAAMERAA